MLTFTQYINVIKDFDQKIKDFSDVRRKILYPYGGFNHDEAAVYKGIELLNKRRKGHKVLIVLSDGFPDCGGCCKDSPFYHRCSASGADMKEELKKSLWEASRNNISVIGIGIMTDYVKHFYKNYTVIQEAEEIFPAILNQMRLVVKRGIK